MFNSLSNSRQLSERGKWADRPGSVQPICFQHVRQLSITHDPGVIQDRATMVSGTCLMSQFSTQLTCSSHTSSGTRKATPQA